MSEKLPKKKSIPTQLLPENRAPKASNAETENRITFIYDLIMEAKRTSEILDIAREKFGIADSTTAILIARAKHRMIENNRQTIEESAAEISAHYWDIINQTKKVKEFNTSIAALKEVSKLKGLDQVTINHVVHDVKELEEIPIDAIEAELVDKKDE